MISRSLGFVFVAHLSRFHQHRRAIPSHCPLQCLPQEANESPALMPSTNEVESTTRESTPLRKVHHWSVCMVPPPRYTRVWELLISARTELRDPGLFRWPPHVNLLYPFLDSYSQNPEVGSETDQVYDLDILERLRLACEKCEPFCVRLRNFGIFGGSKRGVLWLYPECTADGTRNASAVTPLVTLQALLEEQFPMCTDQRKVTGSFQPHMTLSHFESHAAAVEGQSQVESWWSRCDDKDIEFCVDRVYLLTRAGEDGQFKVVSEIPLGEGTTFDSLGGDASQAMTYNPPAAFPSMPVIETDWVREQRMKLKQRRNRKSHRRGRLISPTSKTLAR